MLVGLPKPFPERDPRANGNIERPLPCAQGYARVGVYDSANTIWNSRGFCAEQQHIIRPEHKIWERNIGLGRQQHQPAYRSCILETLP
jgi:hypothetical protein